MATATPTGADGGSRAPRALLVCDHFIRYVTGLAAGLKSVGWDTTLLARDHDHAFGGRPGALAAYLDERLGPDQRRFLLNGRAGQLGGLRSLGAATRAVGRFGPEVTHLQTCVCHDPRLVLAARPRPRRYAVTVHDIDTHPGDRTPPRRHAAIVNPLIRHAGVVFVHAEALRVKLADSGATRAPIVVIPHGVDEAEPVALPSEPSLLFFGRLSEYKGVDVLLTAMAQLWRRRPAVTLTIAGAGPLPEHPALEDSRVRVLNHHILDSEVPALFARCTAVVLPYIEASQSGVGSLAKGHGRPIVASAVGGLPELVADGSGVLVAPGDAAALASSLDALLGDPERQTLMREAGLRTLRDHAGWPAVAELTIDAYARYLGAPRLTPAPRPALISA